MSRSSSKIKIVVGSSAPATESVRDRLSGSAVDKEASSSSLPEAPFSPPEGGRSTAVWRQWLTSMAHNAEAALAAAIAYREMNRAGRDQWLQSLEEDASVVDVPRVALYAPLIAVEEDPECRERLIHALGDEEPDATHSIEAQALRGSSSDGTKVFVLSTPLYLNFVQILACGVRAGCFAWVRHDPIVGADAIPTTNELMENAPLEEIPFKTALDDLALVVLSHKRGGEPLPEALGVLSDFLGAVGP